MADISNIVVNNTLYNIKDANAVHTPLKTINGKTITGSGNIALNARARRIWYGTCTSSSVNKTVTTATNDFSLTDGNMLVVRFSYVENSLGTNLVVDGTTATPVYTTWNASVQEKVRWAAYSIVSFVYFNSKFIMVNSGHATTSVYGKVTLLPTWSVTSQGSTSTTGYDSVTSNALCSLYNYVNTNKLEDSGGTGYNLTLGSEFEVYGSSTVPRVLKWGKIVCIDGCVTPKSNISGGDTNHLICTLPEGCEPQQTFYCIMQGSTRNKWQLTIGSGGNVYFSRHRTIGSWTTCGAGSWLPFNATWIAAE